jgi:hypothetical protein
MSSYQSDQGLGGKRFAQALPGLTFPLPPTFPPGADPETYQIETVRRLLKKAAYLSIFSVHNPAIPNVPIPAPSNPKSLIGIEANEELHRLEIKVKEPTFTTGLRVINRVGEPVANVRVQWRLIPEDFEAAPRRLPPPTELNPTESQRFTFVQGQMTFKDRDRSGFHAFGTGRTFPVTVQAHPQLRVGAVVDVLEGFGKLKGLLGTVVVNGYLEPPQGLFLSFIMRFVDPTGKLRATSTLTGLRPIPPPDPTSTFLIFLGEDDPAQPVKLKLAPDGRILGSEVHERLRLVDINSDIATSQDIRSVTTEGPIVGKLSATLHFNPLDPRPVSPTYTTNGAFTFFDRQGRTIATLNANIVEGRAIPTELSGAPMPIFRFGGFGPFISGTGQFSGVVGMISLNGAISVFPRTLSNLYVLRVSDPNGRFRGVCHEAWS